MKRLPGILFCVVACLAGSGCGTKASCEPATCQGCCSADGLCGSCPGDAGIDGGSDAGVDAGTQCRPSNESPSGRSDFAAAVDPMGERLVLFGGDPGFGMNCTSAPQFDGETWAFDLKCRSWKKLAPAVSPPARARHVGVFDAARRRLVIFGGRYRAGPSGAYTVFNDVHAFDFAAENWAPVQLSGTPPPGLANAAAAIEGDTLYIFGGNSSTSGLTFTPHDRLWAANLAAGTWEEITPATSARPPARLFHAMALDGSRRRLIVFSGGDANAFTGPFLGDLWAFDLATRTWSPLTASGTAPANRIRPSMALDAARDRMLVFGGHDDQALGERNDLSALGLTQTAWSAVRVGDTFNRAGMGVCNFPPDFTTADLQSPERREAHWFGLGSDGQFYMVGGRSDCGVLADVWALNPAAGTWQELKPAFTGVSCARSGKLNCTTLCF